MLKRLLLAALLLPGIANAQFVNGQVLTATQLNNAFAATLPLAGGTLTGPLIVPSLSVTGTPIPLASGGTGATTATGATSSLQYLQGATGSATRSLTSKFQDSVNVRDFNPTACTGTGDDTAAIQAAANASPYVFMPAGACTVSASITISSPVTFWGQGQGATTITPSGSFDVFAFTGSGAGGGVRNLTINASGMTGGNAISNNGQARFTLQNLMITGGYNGIYLQDFNVATVKDVWMNGQTGAYAIKNYGSGIGANNVLDMDNVQIGFSTATASSPVGVCIDGDAATTDMRHVAVVKGYRGLQITNSANLTLGPSFVTAYSFQSDFSYGEGVYIDGGTGATQTIQLLNPYVHGSTNAAGINITSSVRNVVISGGQIDSNYLQGVVTNGRYVKMDSVQISNNSISGSAAQPGIEVGASSVGTTVLGGLSGQWLGYASNNQSYGVQVDSGASSYSVSGVNLLGNVTGAYVDNASNTNSFVGGNVVSSSTVQTVSGTLQSQSGNFTLKGAGTNVVFLGNATNGLAFSAQPSAANSVNYIKAYGNASGGAPTVQAVGSDTNINLQLAATGTGTIIAQSALVANSSVSHTGQEIDKGYAYSTPTTGTTVTLATGTQTAVINPAGTLAALTVTLPACTSGYDGSIARYSSSQAVTALTLNATSGTVSNGLTALSAGGGQKFICHGANTTWYPLY
jgi:hypothetical protein